MRAIEDSKLVTPEYQDDKVSIYKHLGKTFIKWHGEEEKIHYNYMEVKLTEYIGNNFPGAWPIQKNEESMKGMRCFTVMTHKDVLYIEWRN